MFCHLLLGVASGVAVAAPFGMDEAGHALEARLYHLAVVAEAPPVPACPDAGRIHVHDVAAEVATADDGGTGGVKSVREVVQFAHKGADAVRVELLEVARPVVFVAHAPKDDAGVVAVLADHIGEHAACLFAVLLAAQSATAPRNLFPHQKPQLVAEAEDDFRLLVVAQADEVGAHCLDLLHFGNHHLFGEGGTYPGVVFVAMGAA